MAPKKKATRKRTPVRKASRTPVRKPAPKKARPAPPPTIAGVFQLIYSKKGFLDALLADMNAALEAAHCDLPPADRDSLRAMLASSYQITGADALRIIVNLMAQRVAPPPPPWPIMPAATAPPAAS